MLSAWLFISLLSAAPADRRPATPADAPLTLEQAVSSMLARAPARRAAETRLDGARTAARVAGVYPNPAVEIRAENWTFGGWAWTPSLDPAAPLATDFFVVLSQPVDVSGKRQTRRGIAVAEQDGAEAGLSLVERALVLDTVRAYLDAWRNRELLKALESNREGLETLLRAMRARVREGYAPETDLAKFQAESARLDAQLLRTRLELGRQLAVLTSLVAEPLPVSDTRLVDPGDRKPPAGDPVELAKQAASRAPLVRVARARAEQATKVLALERAQQKPDLYVAGGYKRTAGADTAVLGVSLSVPLFDRNQRAVAMATGDAQAAAFDAAALEARVAAETRMVFVSAQALGERAGRVDIDLIAPAEIVRAAARSSFREGAADILTLVDAERVYLEAHREALQLKLEAVAAAVEARLLLGEEIHQ